MGVRSNPVVKAVIFLIMGCAFVFVGVNGLLRKGNPWGDWISAEAVVYGYGYSTKSRLSRGSSTFRTSFIPLVKFRYSVDGVEYESENVSLFSASARTLEELEEVYELFPVGKRIKVWYLKKEPKDAYIYVNVPKWIKLQVGGVVMLGSVLLLCGIFILRKANRAPQTKC